MERQAYDKLGWELPFKVDISVGENWGELEEMEVIPLAA